MDDAKEKALGIPAGFLSFVHCDVPERHKSSIGSEGTYGLWELNVYGLKSLMPRRYSKHRDPSSFESHSRFRRVTDHLVA